MPSIASRDFDDCFRVEFPKIVRELEYVLGDQQLALDVTQEAFIRQYIRWARISHYDRPGAWVRKVAFRIAFRRSRRLRLETELSDASNIPAETPSSDREVDVRAAIQLLSESQRVAVVLHYYRDLPISEVAHIMGCRESTAKVHLHRARLRLADLLIDYGPEPRKFKRP